MRNEDDYIDDFIREDSIETETADEIFKKLGYELETHISRLVYKKIDIAEEIEEDIMFYFDGDTVEKYGGPITMPELQAINKKIKELRSVRLWD